MIDSFIKAWDAHQGTLKGAIMAKGRDVLDYEELLKLTLSHCFPDHGYGDPDVSNVHVINDGNYQGTLVYMVPEKCYQPSTYYLFKVSYGSCSCCDTMESISSDGAWDAECLSDNQVNLLWTEALHMMQEAKEV